MGWELSVGGGAEVGEGGGGQGHGTFVYIYVYYILSQTQTYKPSAVFTVIITILIPTSAVFKVVITILIFITPQYLSYLQVEPYTPTRQLHSTSNTCTLVTPCMNTEIFGER